MMSKLAVSTSSRPFEDSPLGSYPSASIVFTVERTIRPNGMSPADAVDTSPWPRFSAMISAMGERQVLPMQMKRIESEAMGAL